MKTHSSHTIPQSWFWCRAFTCAIIPSLWSNSLNKNNTWLEWLSVSRSGVHTYRGSEVSWCCSVLLTVASSTTGHTTTTCRRRSDSTHTNITRHWKAYLALETSSGLAPSWGALLLEEWSGIGLQCKTRIHVLCMYRLLGSHIHTATLETQDTGIEQQHVYILCYCTTL